MAQEKFEAALARLEEIVRELEGGDLTLDESLKIFEEGIKLSGICSRKLDEAERRVEVLLKCEQDLVTKPFAEGESDEG